MEHFAIKNKSEDVRVKARVNPHRTPPNLEGDQDKNAD
jgi:hypothetical protein